MPMAQEEAGGNHLHFQGQPTEVRIFLLNLDTQANTILPLQDYPMIHPVVRQMFSSQNLQDIPAAGRLKYFLQNWEKLTQDPQILQLVKGYQIPFHTYPLQQFPPHPLKLNKEEQLQVDTEVQNMLTKGAIKEVPPSVDKFLSTIFLVPKKDSGHRPVINLKTLNSHIPYCHFKMEGLFLVKELLQPGDYM